MYATIGSVTFILGILIASAIFIAAWKIDYARYRKRKGIVEKRRRIEYTKLIIALVLFTYFLGVAIGIWVVVRDTSQLSVVLAFIGTPTVAAIGFYVWKAKAENIIKIKKENPEETAGISVDLNNIST